MFNETIKQTSHDIDTIFEYDFSRCGIVARWEAIGSRGLDVFRLNSLYNQGKYAAAHANMNRYDIHIRQSITRRILIGADLGAKMKFSAVAQKEKNSN